MAVIKKVELFFRGGQTVGQLEPTVSNATQINVRLYSWIRCRQAVI